MAANLYSIAASGVLALHLVFVLWVIFGALVAHRRPVLRWLHILSLIWAIIIELFPWSCPLTLLENWLETRAGVEPYQDGFLLHYLDALVYPNISALVLTIAGVVVCILNFVFYGLVFARSRARRLALKKAVER
ncbi:MAG TPA: DUF2784 domain-containing protein [Terriglobales bacterium]|nr:DUF2784 domain-containing protein [Terriglobales bacterium]